MRDVNDQINLLPDDLEDVSIDPKFLEDFNSELDIDVEDEDIEKENAPSYFFVDGKEKSENPLSEVIGHENQKKEILAVMDWFNRSKELKEKGVTIPKGCVMFGPPGCGKSLLIKEIIKCCGCPTFIFNGENENVVGSIVETFKKAREAGHAIIVFDELDLLINRERRVARALQECLDGVESCDDILVLAATNDIDEIPDPLLRNGRLDKIIQIPYPTCEEAVALLKKYFNEFKITLPEGFDEEEVGILLNRTSCSTIKAIVNDLVLRNGFENITTEMLDKSIYDISKRVKSRKEEDSLNVAVHEASHALVASLFPQHFKLNRLNIDGASGEFRAKEVAKDLWTYDKVIADIKICYAGIIGERVIMGIGSRGCECDLNRARMDAYNMFNVAGYSSCWETLPPVREGSRTETQIKRRRMERKIERLLKKCEKDVYKIVKKNKSTILALGQRLFEKKNLKSSEILAIIG